MFTSSPQRLESKRDIRPRVFRFPHVKSSSSDFPFVVMELSVYCEQLLVPFSNGPK